jgi:protein-disulfide isomerase
VGSRIPGGAGEVVSHAGSRMVRGSEHFIGPSHPACQEKLMIQRILAPLAVALLISGAAIAADTESSTDVVATVGDVNITRADLEKSVRSQLIEVDNQRYEILEDGLNNLVSEKLLELDAKAKGKTSQDLQKEIMSAPVDEPTDEQVQKVFDENKEQLGGKSLDEVKGRIVEYLKNQSRAQKAQAMLADLRAKYPTQIKLSPPVIEVSDGGRSSRGGGASAPITIVAFSDYECPYCKKSEDVVALVMTTYGDKVRYVHRDYPLPFHKSARPAAETARCAGEQGKFWEVHDALYKEQALTPEKVTTIAVAAGVDKTKLDECMASGKAKTMVDEDLAAGGEVGVSGTPAYFINGRMLSGAQPIERFKSIIDSELAKAGKS